MSIKAEKPMKGKAPTPEQVATGVKVTQRPAGDVKENLNFKVSPEFRAEFKQAAARFGKKGNELLIDMFNHYLSTHK